MSSVQVDVVGFFEPAEIESMARETGFVRRSSQITGMRFLLTFTAGWKEWDAFRNGARLMGVLFTILTLLGAVWCLLVWGDLAILFSRVG